MAEENASWARISTAARRGCRVVIPERSLFRTNAASSPPLLNVRRSATHFDGEWGRHGDAWIVELRSFGRSRDGVRVVGKPDLRLTESGVGYAGEAREVVEMDRFNFGCFGVQLQ